MTDVSIIIVSWNAKKFLIECLGSIAACGGQLSKEIIVVDNASSDGTPELLRKEYPHVCLLEAGRNLGYAGGNNVGIQRSSGRYVCIINSDVKVLDDCLEKIVRYMDAQHRIGLLGPRMLSPYGKVQRSCMRFPTIWNNVSRAFALDSLFPHLSVFASYLMDDFGHDRAADVDVINGCFWMVRREALDEVGCLDDSFFMYGEDIDWCRRFHAAGWRVTFYPEAKAIHYGGASSANAPIRFSVEMQKANLHYWRKHKGRLRRLAYQLTLWIHHAIRMSGYAALYLVNPSKRSQAVFEVRRSAACIRYLMGLEIAREKSL